MVLEMANTRMMEHRGVAVSKGEWLNSRGKCLEETE